jgi:hypothetical protein
MPTTETETTPAQPDWLETPDLEYQLQMWDVEGDSAQGIDLCREEFIALKDHLARMRGVHQDRKAGPHEVEAATEASAAIDGREVPGWINETPDERVYQLVIFDGDGDCRQEVDTTRKEFITLKRCLAALRGYELMAPGDHTEIQARTLRDDGGKASTLEIRQYEISMVMDLEQALDRLVLNLKSRLAQGAEVETGTWRLHDDGSRIEDYDGETAGIGRCGLDIVQTRGE